TDYLADGRLTPLTGRAAVPVTERLNVVGYDHVYALGDITDVPEPKMASYAMEHAQVITENIRSQLAGGRPTTTYTPCPVRRILLPLGPHGGVGQVPLPGGITAVTAETVSQRKGLTLFTERFAERFDRG
ncbi:MAG: FAD-dependent oxidoreductase, partial [Umezawaea sp.]